MKYVSLCIIFPCPLTTEELRVFLIISKLVFRHCRELRLLLPSKIG